MAIDPKNFQVKFEFTKSLIEKNDIWKGLIEFMRTKSIVEEKLITQPESPSLL